MHVHMHVGVFVCDEQKQAQANTSTSTLTHMRGHLQQGQRCNSQANYQRVISIPFEVV